MALVVGDWLADGSNGDWQNQETAEVPSFTRPVLVVSDQKDGSVTIDVSSNLLSGGGDQTSRLKYQKSSDTAWTVLGSSITGNQAGVSGPSGLDHGRGAEFYMFQLVPYDSVTGAEGPASKPVAMRLADADQAADPSDIDDLAADQVAAVLSAGGEEVVITPTGGDPVTCDAIVDLSSQSPEYLDDGESLRRKGTVTIATDSTYGVESPKKGWTVAIRGEDWHVDSVSEESGGMADLEVGRFENKVRGGGLNPR